MGENRRAVRLRVGRTIKQLRRLRDWNQAALAEASEISEKHLGLIERGRANVTVDVLTQIADSLAVDVADLFGRRSSARRRVFVITGRHLALVNEMKHAMDLIATQHRRRRH